MSGFVFSSSRRRSCWKVGIPRCLRDFQARWESRFLDFSTERLFNSLRLCCFGDRCALAGVVPEATWPVGHAEGAVEVLVHDDVAPGEGAAPTYLVDLQDQVLEADGVVAADGALELQRKDQIQITAGACGEGCAALGRRHLETAIELGHVVLTQEAVGLCHGVDP